MNSRVQHASATAAQYEPTIDEVSRRLEAVDLRRKTLMDELHGMKAAKDVSQKRLQEVARAMTALKQQQAAVVADASAQVPRVKCVEWSGFLLRRCHIAPLLLVQLLPLPPPCRLCPTRVHQQALTQPLRQHIQYQMGLRLDRCCGL